MKPILTLLAALLLAPLAALHAVELAPAVIYVTDFYRPYADPDDHFDMACVFSMAFQKQIDLRGICLDYTRDGVLDGTEKRGLGDPDIVSVAQLQAITGISVPVAVGSSKKLRSPDDAQTDGKPGDLAAAHLILQQLNESPGPVAIVVGGGCRDVALALLQGRDVFEKKCRGIYWLGSVAEYRDERVLPEANYKIDPAAFQTVMMTAPCPLYWMPGF